MLQKQRRASKLIVVSIDQVRRRKLSARQASTAWAVKTTACLVTLENFKMNQRKHRAKSVQKVGQTALEHPRRATSAHLESTPPPRDPKIVTSVRLVGSKYSQDRTIASVQRRVPSSVVTDQQKSASPVGGVLPSVIRTVSA